VEAKELLRSGRLSEARENLIAAVKSAPTDLSFRTLLFQVLVLSGEWDKAERHLNAIVQQNPDSETGVQVYKNLLHAEKERLEVVKQGRRPCVFPESPVYLDAYLAAWQALETNQLDRVNELIAQVDEQIPQLVGTLNGRDFRGLIDTDQFLCRFLETFTYERYVWMPFEAIRELIIEPPKTLFDLIWTSARITTWSGHDLNCYLPVLYPESYLHEDERVKMGRMTDWLSQGGGYARGAGQHVFQFGEQDIGLLEIREIVFAARE